MKFIGDTLKDNDGAWDVVRMIAGPACVVATGIILVRMALDADLAKNALLWAAGLGAVWGSYAAAVVGHGYAKK